MGAVHWINLEALCQQPDDDPMINLLTLPERPEHELPACSQQNVDATVSGANQDPVVLGRYVGLNPGEAAATLLANLRDSTLRCSLRKFQLSLISTLTKELETGICLLNK